MVDHSLNGWLKQKKERLEMGALFLFFYWEDGGWGYAGQMKIFFFEDF